MYVEVSAPTLSANVIVMVQPELWEGNVSRLGHRKQCPSPFAEGHNLGSSECCNIQTHTHQVFQARHKRGISLSQ